MNWLARLILPVAFACFAFPALAEKRVALVIGNAAYKHAPALANPRNDAEGVAASLRRLNFDVLLGVDLDEAGMRRVLRGFADKVEGLGKDDVALVFYAGHGLQVNGRNYLVPVDAKLEKESDLGFQAVSLDFLQQLMEQTPHTNIVILDSCRDNPLARSLARGMGTRSAGIGRGLAEMRGINDTLIVYATSPGNVALDGDTKHSPFTEALLKHVETPGLEVRHMISQVRSAVIEATKGKQVPWESASLTRQIYFAAASGVVPPPVTATPPPAPDNEALFWSSIKDGTNIAHFKAYLARWPQGVFAELARSRIDELEKAAVREEEEKKRKAAEDERKRAEEEARRGEEARRADEARKAEEEAKRKPVPPPRQQRVVQGKPRDLCETGTYQLIKPPVLPGGVLTWTGSDCNLYATSSSNYPVASLRAEGKRLFWRQVVSQTNAEHVMDCACTLKAGAAPPPAPPAAAAAPRSAASAIAEMQRKATAREKAGALCATVPWPKYESAARFFEYLERPVGTWHMYVHGNRQHDQSPTSLGIGCELFQIRFIGTHEGRRCVRSMRWYCTGYNGQCNTEPAHTWCKKADGGWTSSGIDPSCKCP